MNTGASMSLIENNAGGVGHYKGVMLCNRPFAGTAVPQKTQSSSEKLSFSTGVVSAPVGVNVPISMKEKMIKRPKKDSVLVKHKKWLSDLQKTKERLEEQYLEDMRKKEEEKLRFQDHEKRMRELSRTILHSAAESKNPESSDQNDKKVANDADGQADSKVQPSEAKESKKSNKPAWALTEDKAEFASDAKQQREEDELLDFAKSLNYDKYIVDMEVKTMMERLHKRIEELEKEVALDEQRENDAELRAARREMLELMGNVESSLRQQEEEKRTDDVAMNAAKTLLDEDENMQAVHSTKSVVQLLKSAKEKINTVRNSVKPEVKDSEPKVLYEPKVVFHEPNEGARMDGKNTISNLPYMHRNPAV